MYLLSQITVQLCVVSSPGGKLIWKWWSVLVLRWNIYSKGGYIGGKEQGYWAETILSVSRRNAENYLFQQQQQNKKGK